MKKNKLNKAFTIVELLIFMGIFSILLLVLTDIITSSLNMQLETRAVSSVEQDGRYILNRLNYDMHRARNIIQPSALGTPASTQMQLNIGGLTYTYSIVSNNLNMYDGTTNYILNSYDTTASQLSVTRIGSLSNLDTLKIGFTLTGKAQLKSGFETKNYSTTIGLRCYNSTNCQ